MNEQYTCDTIDLNELNGTTGDDTLVGGDNNDSIFGDRGDDFLAGAAGNDVLNGSFGNDEIIGGLDSDTLTGGSESDLFTYTEDPFAGVDISSPERQIIGEEDFITDFNFAEDKYRFSTNDFDVSGDVRFTAVDANAEGASISLGTNVVSLLNSDNDNNPDTPFLAGTAANQIAELTSEDGAGFFVYFNSNLDLNRVVYSTNLNDANADLKIISRQTNLTGAEAIAALNNFSASNFRFEDIQLNLAESSNEPIQNDLNNELIGTTGDDTLIGSAADDFIFGDRGDDFLAGAAGNDVIDGSFGNDKILGGEGSDTITGGSESDSFIFAEDPFAGADISSPERQIIGEEDFITDFNFAEDKYRFSTNDFDIGSNVNFTGVAANAPDALIAPGTNVVSLLNSDNDNNPDTPFLAGTAANQIAELTSEDGAGFFVYFNSNLELNRVVYSTNLNDANADLKIISRQTNLTGADAIAALDDFSVNNFEFEAI